MTPAARPFDDIRALIREMPSADEAAVAAAREREGQLTKPAGSLGRLEEISAFMAGWQGAARPHVDKPLVAVFAGNHGVVAQGVSPFPQSVTQAMVANFTAGGAAINQICKTFDISLKVYELALEKPTGDITQEPAMDERTCAGTIAYGMEALATEPDLLVLGEMGIGNTTAAAAIYHALYGGEAEDWVGRGTGVDDAGLKRKAEAVRAAVASPPGASQRSARGSGAARRARDRRDGRRDPRRAHPPHPGRARRLRRLLGRRGSAGARPDRARSLPRRPCLGRARARASAEAARQDAAARSRHAARRGLGRGAGGRHRQGRRRLPQRHGDVRGSRGGGERRRAWNSGLSRAFQSNFISCDGASRATPISSCPRDRRRSTSLAGHRKGAPSLPDNKRWSAVDAYFTGMIVGQDKALAAALAANDAAGLPQIDVSPPQGKLLHLMARMAGARKALEIGALGGYSTIWIARALPADGLLVTLEADKKHAAVARANVAHAGLADRVDVRVGPALETLPKVEAEGLGPFDFVFIDADKSNNANYLGWALRLSRPGTVIVVDNIVRDGRIADASAKDPDVAGTRQHVRHDGARAAPAGDGNPDRRRQGLGWIRAGDRWVRARSALASARCHSRQTGSLTGNPEEARRRISAWIPDRPLRGCRE